MSVKLDEIILIKPCVFFFLQNFYCEISKCQEIEEAKYS